MAEAPVLLASQPGIKRDGTKFEGDYYVDGRWCRFQRGKPRKMGGYQQVTDTVPEITRGMSSFSADNQQFLHLGHPDTFGQYIVSNGTLSTFNDRTPAGFAANVDNLWQMTLFSDVAGLGAAAIIAHAGLNNLNIDNSTATPIYGGLITASGVLTAASIGLNDMSGGVVASSVYLFAYGSDGLIEVSAANDVSAGFALQVNVSDQKIVKGFPLRGAGTGPAALFWSLDSVIRATFADTPLFAFDTIATDTSILSSQGVVEYDGIFYWPGVDRWYMYNGVVREMPNNMNLNFFFDNINFTHRQKCFGYKIPRFGELWWCFPKGAATECNHAVIYNVRENTWYDTALPDSDDVDQGRTAGVFAKVYQRPFMVDNEVTANGRTLWQHETAKDKIRISQISAIQSFFETHELSMLEQGKGTKSVRVARIEPDFVQVGDMTLTVRGRANAKATQTTDAPKTFSAVAATPTDQTIKLKQIKRLMSFRFESNTGAGDYEYGDTYAHIEPADGRVED